MKVKPDKVSLIKDHYVSCYQHLTVKIMEVWLSILKNIFALPLAIFMFYFLYFHVYIP